MKKIIVISFFLFAIYAFTEDFFFGYGFGKIKNPKNYKFYTLMFDFSRPIRSSKNFFFQIEPFISYVESPSDNFEIGLSFFTLYKFSSGNIQPYIKVGTGIIYLSTDFVEQSTHFNFVSSACFGIKFGLKRISFYTEGRIRHVSNAGIKEPNEGINSKIFLIGLSYNF
ncbi:MAG: acyloxyacyl hydrolase [Candidatus Omnitrophica bacterium]|nr:acyloxyacyl hydrolase [Candidatus Omnitrophota bacterium]MCM8807023.1 acyloxyacyl hydrolase [Candidatus Omnitrophota bacterium]